MPVSNVNVNTRTPDPDGETEFAYMRSSFAPPVSAVARAIEVALKNVDSYVDVSPKKANDSADKKASGSAEPVK